MRGIATATRSKKMNKSNNNPPPKNEVFKPNTNMPAGMMERMQADAGKGLSTKAEDNIVPIITVLQPLSPQLQRSSTKYISSAMAGDIMMKNAANPIIKGESGIIFQPCYFMKEWVEWVPRTSGGGFVARHEQCPEDVKEIKDPQNPNKIRYLR